MRHFTPRLVAGMLALATLAAGTRLDAQEGRGTIIGTITVQGGVEPLADVRVEVGGTALEVFTNESGEYRILSVPDGLHQITAYKVGYQAASDTVRVVAGGTATLNLTMERSRIQLSDVVITGTAGNQERRAQAAVVTSLNVEELVERSPAQNMNQILQSRVPSVSVSSASGTIGTSARINIRGASSINLSNQPLIFIDGVRLIEGQPDLDVGGQSADRFNSLNPEDIESIEIVKGPAAATLYGADASAGVIQIITRRGRAGTPRFTQRVSMEFGRTVQDWTPPANFARCRAQDVDPTSVNPLCVGQAVGTLVSDNPLVREEAFENGFIRNFGYSASGGGQGYGYYVSLNRDRQTGTFPSNAFGRQSWRTNFTFVPDPRVTVNASLSIHSSTVEAPINDNNIFGFLGGGLLGTPLSRTVDGSGADGWFGVERDVASISAIVNELDTRGTTAGININYVPNSWLSHRFVAGLDMLSDEQTNFFPRSERGSYVGLLNTGSNTQVRRNVRRYTLDYLANIRNFFGEQRELELNTSLGLQLISTDRSNIDITGTGFVTNENNVPGAASQTSGGGGITEVHQLGYVAQVQLGHLDRRFLQLGLRVDQFSAFGVDVDPAILPKVGASWVISEEPFFGDARDFVNTLRLRAAWGSTGRAPEAGAALRTLESAPSVIQGSVSSGAVPDNPGNPGLKPERGTEVEFGFDASFLDERLSLEMTYYNKTTNDLILQRPLPPSLGFLEDPFVNIGQVVNSGLEVSMSATPILMDAFAWDIRGGFSTLHNELTDLGGVSAFGTLNRFTEGYQLGSFVSKQIRNIDQTTGIVTVADTFEVVGNLFPTLEATISNTFTFFDQLRLTAQFDTKRNFLVYNNTAFFRETQLVRSAARLDSTRLSQLERLRRYGNEAPGAPAFIQENGVTTTVNQVRDFFLQPGDFVRFRELGLSWDIPERWLGFTDAISSATIGLAVRNVYLWTNPGYTGADPEVISNADAQFTRSDFLTQPNPRSTVLRVNITF